MHPSGEELIEAKAKDALELSETAQYQLLERAILLQEQENYGVALECLAPLKNKESTVAKVLDKIDELENIIIQKEFEKAQRDTERKGVSEVEERLIYPKTYGQQITIGGEDINPNIPVGPMEEIVNRPVSMDLSDASVQDVIMALNRVEGLNIIADNALSSPTSLTVKVSGVPLKELLSYIARNMGIAFHINENVIWVTAVVETDETSPQLETAIFKLNSGLIPVIGEDSAVAGVTNAVADGADGAVGGTASDELDDVLANFVSFNQPGALFRIYKNRNLLLVKNTRENVRLVEALLKEFDSEVKQVLIEARFLTISQTDLLELGVNLETIQRQNPDLPKELQTVTNDLFRSFPADGNLELGGVIDNWEYNLVLHAIDEKTSARTISSPRVTVLNNHTAIIRRGETLRYFEEYDLETAINAAGVTVSEPVPTGDVQEIQLGINLEVKPSIGHDGKKVLLDLKPNIVELIQFDEYINARLPRTSENSIETKAVVRSGQTIILGGMITETRQHDDNSIPFLGRLPLLRQLFSENSVNKSPLNLIIFVTVTIIDSSGNSVKIKD
jgi:type II secretory pathway component GspD/PulD (secretin)